MTGSQPRLLIGGTGSGCGKTTVSSAILRALQRRGVSLCAFKCGPDYIDPMFHRAALGLPSYNLDLFFLSESQIRALTAQHLQDQTVGIMEGVMGFYDGVSGTTDQASAAHLARATQTPAILTVRPKGQSLSLAAMVQGFLQFAPNTIQGVILNDVSKGMYPFYRSILERAGVKVYGFLPPVPESEIPDRHLGLVTAAEIGDIQIKLDRLADAAEECLDLDGLLELAHTAPPLTDQFSPITPIAQTPIRIGVAQDRAFCFYYQDNLDMLTALGAELVPFSPLEDTSLPEAIDGLYIGGGYPELYAPRLAANRQLRAELKEKIGQGLPTIAECGGFMYLGEEICCETGVFPMVGALPGRAELTARLQNFGYTALTAKKDCLLCKQGQVLPAHEFHYSKSEFSGCDFTAKKPNGKQWDCVFASHTLYAGYPHLYFRAIPASIRQFLEICIEMRAK